MKTVTENSGRNLNLMLNRTICDLHATLRSVNNLLNHNHGIEDLPEAVELSRKLYEQASRANALIEIIKASSKEA